MVASNQADPTAGFDYENNNFALFRIILPALWTATLDTDTFENVPGYQCKTLRQAIDDAYVY
jgi:hypothetical protein